jgi:hypothetical protein
MRKVALMTAVLFALAAVLAPVGTALAGDKGGKSHEAKGEVVSVNVDTKELTFKTDAGETKTAAVLGKAIDTLKNLKPGDKITLTCSDNEKGEHLGISDIKVTPASGSSGS